MTLTRLTLEERGINIDIALSTEEGIERFKAHKYDIVISDMARPEGKKAGIDLAKKIRAIDLDVPFIIFCGKWAAQNMAEESLKAGVSYITSSGTILFRVLPLSE